MKNKDKKKKKEKILDKKEINEKYHNLLLLYNGKS